MPVVEIHVSSVEHLTVRGGGTFCTFRSKIDERTAGMLEARIPARLDVKIGRTQKNRVGFNIVKAGVRGAETYALTVVIRDHKGHVQYSNGHAMVAFDVPQDVYKELRAYLDPSLLAEGYATEFDFEPLNNPRNYTCNGTRKVLG